MSLVLYITRWNLDASAHLIEVTARLPGVRLAVISGEPARFLPEQVRSLLVDYQEVADVLDVSQLLYAAQRMVERHGPLHRIFGVWEYLQEPIAQLRKELSVEGMDPRTAHAFRDKAQMKERWRAAGLPCARHQLVTDLLEAPGLAAKLGYPLIVKPPSGLGSLSTSRVRSPEALEAALLAASARSGGPVLLEEELTGQEGSLEAVVLDGEVIWQSRTHYLLNMLHFIERPGEPYRVVLPREQPRPGTDEICDLAPRALAALGMRTGICHLEWFQRANGSIVLSEVAARPPGGHLSTLISEAHGADFLRAWAELLIFGRFQFPPRTHAAGVVLLRARGQGRIRAVHGLTQAEDEFGEMIAQARMPRINQLVATEGYEGEGLLIVKHPETAAVERAVRKLGELIQIEAS